jgi:hypothetical protein
MNVSYVLFMLFQDGCFTSDSDSFLFGARTVYRDVFIGITIWSGYSIMQMELHIEERSCSCTINIVFCLCPFSNQERVVMSFATKWKT